jgi:hypothetical protein
VRGDDHGILRQAVREQEADHPDIVMTIVTNSDDYPQLQVIVEAESTVSAGDQAIRTA